MDIAKMFDHERLFPLELKSPLNEEKTGVVFMIRSASNDATKRIIRKHVDQIAERQQRGKLIKGETRIQQELEKAASYIASWDWGENTYKGEKPEFSFEKAIEILDDQDWIYSQIVEAANRLENFTVV